MKPITLEIWSGRTLNPVTMFNACVTSLRSVYVEAPSARGSCRTGTLAKRRVDHVRRTSIETYWLR